MKFTKGKSGNPGGRPKESHDVRELARQATPEAIERLGFWMRSDNPRASVSASMALLDRAWGKPESKVTIDDKRDATDWSRAELVAFLNNARNGGERAANTDGSGPEPDRVH